MTERTSKKQYVSAIVSYGKMTDIDKPGIIVAFYGTRGGTVCVAELSQDQASSLRDQLSNAIKTYQLS